MLAKDHEAEFTGLDLSPEMIKQANNKNIKNAKFVEGRSDKIPFDDNTFNIVILYINILVILAIVMSHIWKRQ